LALGQNNDNPGDPSGFLAVLDLRTGAHRSLEALPVNAWITSVGFTPDGRSIVGRSFDGGVRVWDAASGSIVHTFTGQASGQNVVIVPSGRTALAGSEDGSVVAWDLSGKQRLGRAVRWSSPQKGCVDTPCQAIDPQSTLMATTQADGTTALIDLRRLRLLDTLPAKNGSATYPYAVAFLPDGRTLATGGINGNVTLWDVRTRSVVRTLHLPDPVRQVAISPDGELLASQTQGLADSDAKVEVRDLSSEKLLYSHRVRYGAGGVYFSPDGRALAALGCCEPDSSIVVWNARSGAELFTPHADGKPNSIAFSPDSRLLGAGMEDGRVVFWDSRNGKQLGSPIQVATGFVYTVGFSPDGRLLVAGSSDQTTTLLDLRSRKPLGNAFPNEQAAITIPTFEPNGDLFINYLSNGEEWPIDVRTWERYACQVAGRDLTRAEWADLLPNRPYQRLCPH
jgi:WD40 repeat protein